MEFIFFKGQNPNIEENVILRILKYKNPQITFSTSSVPTQVLLPSKNINCGHPSLVAIVWWKTSFFSHSANIFSLVLVKSRPLYSANLLAIFVLFFSYNFFIERKGSKKLSYTQIYHIFSASCIHIAAIASEGMRQSPRGLKLTLPTLGPSGKQERLNCWLKKRRTNTRNHFLMVSSS